VQVTETLIAVHAWQEIDQEKGSFTKKIKKIKKNSGTSTALHRFSNV